MYSRIYTRLNWFFDYIGEPEEDEILFGDVNFDGSIDIIDVIIIMDYIIFEQEINDTQLYISDLNSDLIINVMDIIILVEYILLN